MKSGMRRITGIKTIVCINRLVFYWMLWKGNDDSEL